MSFNVFEALEWVRQYQRNCDEVDLLLLEYLTTKPIKREGKYMLGRFKTWKERINTNFCGQKVSYDMYCNAKVKC